VLLRSGGGWSWSCRGGRLVSGKLLLSVTLKALFVGLSEQ